MQSVLQALEEYFGYDVSSRNLLSAYTTLHARNRAIQTVDLCKFFFFRGIKTTILCCIPEFEKYMRSLPKSADGVPIVYVPKYDVITRENYVTRISYLGHVT